MKRRRGEGKLREERGREGKGDDNGSFTIR